MALHAESKTAMKEAAHAATLTLNLAMDSPTASVVTPKRTPSFKLQAMA
jgi:hypothetical protein